MSKTYDFIFKALLHIVALVFLSFVLYYAKQSYEYSINTVRPYNSIALYGDIDNELAAKVIKRIHELQDGSENPIFICIDSNGGDVYAGLKIIDAMRASKRPIYTIAIGKAESMAIYIHQYGVKRYMLPHSFFMLHNASVSFSDNPDAEKALNRMTMIRYLIIDLNRNVSNRTGVPMQELAYRENNEWWILPDEALARHFVDDVINPSYYPSK